MGKTNHITWKWVGPSGYHSRVKDGVFEIQELGVWSKYNNQYSGSASLGKACVDGKAVQCDEYDVIEEIVEFPGGGDSAYRYNITTNHLEFSLYGEPFIQVEPSGLAFHYLYKHITKDKTPSEPQTPKPATPTLMPGDKVKFTGTNTEVYTGGVTYNIEKIDRDFLERKYVMFDTGRQSESCYQQLVENNYNLSPACRWEKI